MTHPPMVQPTISIHRTPDEKWRCVVPRSSTQFLIAYLRRRGNQFLAQPEGGVDHFDFPGEMSFDEVKAMIRGFGARVLRPGEVEAD
jgi:hypothetical protein